MHKIGSRVEASTDKEGLFKTLNAPIKNTYKSIKDGFWNVLVEKEKNAPNLEVRTKIRRLKCTCSPHVSTLKLKCVPSKLAPKSKKQLIIIIQELNNQTV